MTEPPRAELPAELEARLAAVEAASLGADFDGVSWFWIILLGVAIPGALIITGWIYGASGG